MAAILSHFVVMVRIQLKPMMTSWHGTGHYWPFVRRIYRPPVDFHKGPAMRRFSVYFNTVSPNELLNKQTSCQWLKTPFMALMGRHCSTYLHRYVWADSWWRHQMETFSALLALCAGNSPVTGEFPAQRPVTRRLDVFYDLRLNKRLSKQSWGWWFETPSRPLWRNCNVLCFYPISTLELPSIYYTTMHNLVPLHNPQYIIYICRMMYSLFVLK